MYNILIVDDDESTRSEIKRVLIESQLPLVLTEAADGLEASRVLTSQSNTQFHLLIVDYNMPKMNGLDFIETTLQSPTTGPRYNDVPIMMYTTETDLDLIKRARGLSKNLKWVIKPLEPRAFAMAVSSCLGAQVDKST